MPKKKIDYKKIIGFWLLVFLVGGLAGVFFSRAVLPWLANFAPFNKIGWLDNVKDGTMIINKTEKIYITQETAYQEAINKVSNFVVAIRVERAGRTPIENSGFVLTSDGLIATASFILAKDAKILAVLRDKEYEARMVKQDKNNKLALLKINETNLSVADFGDSNDLQLGEKVFLLGAAKNKNDFYQFANFGFVRALLPEVSFNFTESPLADGAALGNLAGKILGLALVDKQGNIKLIGADKIRELMK